MPYFNEPWRSLAKAAKLRDWETIDAVLADQKVCGRSAIIQGERDALRELGKEPQLPPLKTPEPVTIHDLSDDDRARAKIIGVEGDTHRFELKAA